MSSKNEDEGATGHDTSPGRPQYEFNDEQGRIIADLAAKMRFVGVLVGVLGGVSLLEGLSRLPEEGITAASVVAMLTALVLIAIGYWSTRAGREFPLVDQTKGADITHLMRALENIRRLYGLQYVIGWVVLILLVVAVIFGFFADRAF